MSNPFDEIRTAVREAREQLKAADNSAGDMAALLVGRLRHCSPYVLGKLKRELRDFNMATKEWKP